MRLHGGRTDRATELRRNIRARLSLCHVFQLSDVIRRPAANVGLGIGSSQRHNKNVKMLRLSKSSKVGRPFSLNPLVLCNFPVSCLNCTFMELSYA
jgi:hypothetical protein